ncbi:MAG: hypothetical protein AB7E30_04020 [Lawsonibacter sp.]
MEESSQEELYRQLQIVEASMPFYVLSILPGILVWRTAVIRRAGLCDVLQGKSEKLPDILPIRMVSNAIVVGSLTFFFGIALNAWEESKTEDESTRYSAHLEMWIALFVLVAALMQMYNLHYIQTHKPSLEEEEEEIVLPD